MQFPKKQNIPKSLLLKNFETHTNLENKGFLQITPNDSTISSGRSDA
jgi:hypothetical protein